MCSMSVLVLQEERRIFLKGKTRQDVRVDGLGWTLRPRRIYRLRSPDGRSIRVIRSLMLKKEAKGHVAEK